MEQGLQGMGVCVYMCVCVCQVCGASSTSRWVPGLDGEQEEMGAPLAFTPKRSPARDANPELPTSLQRSS